MVIAYLILIYVITQLLGGNGAIAALFFGLMLKNSKQLTSIIEGIVTKSTKMRKKAIKGELGVSVTTPSEQLFYRQISFFLKTFFFVYIGILLDLSNTKALIIGIIISLLLTFSRISSMLLSRKLENDDRTLVNSMFARGLAAAAIAQLAIQSAIPHATFLAKVTYIVIAGTIILSSLRVFLIKRKIRFPHGI